MSDNTFVNTLAARFENLDDLDVITQTVTRVPKSKNDIAAIPPYQIKSHIGDLLSNLYVPTSQDLALLQKLVQTARAHHDTTYQSDRQYLDGLYTHYEQFEVQQQSPICLTGPAGVGKTSLLHAMHRLLPPPTELDLNLGIGPMQLHSHWHMQVKARSTFLDLALPLIRTELGDTNKRPALARAVALSAKTAFKSGVSLLIVDEMQFLTQGSSAHAAITKLLYQLSYIGKPFVFAANYSLCCALKRRPEQDRQRLLSSPVVLTPSSPDSVDWANYLRSVQHVLGESLQIDFRQERFDIYQLTAGLKRLVLQLLKLAYDQAWQKDRRHITMSDINAAYNHTEYAVSRDQAQAMLSPHTQRSAEYTCPFPLPKVAADELIRAKNWARSKEIVASIQRDTLLQSEKQVLESIHPPKTPKVPSAPKRAKLSVDELRQASARRLNSASTR